MNIEITSVLGLVGTVLTCVGVAGIAYFKGHRRGVKDEDTRLKGEVDAYYEKCKNILISTGCNAIDVINSANKIKKEYLKKTGIDLNKEVVVLENDEALTKLAETAINEHGFGREGDRDYNFKIICIAQKDD